MDQLFQRMRNEGESIGIEKGKLNTLKELLKIKFGYLSSNLEEQLTKASLDKLEVLTVNIFNINSEEDVLKLFIKKREYVFILSYFSFTYCLKILPLSS